MYGIDTDWFADYLAGHTQQVRMRGANGTDINSRPRDNSIGVFQGGSLSCVLFMLFSNDLSLYVPEGVKILQFADDTQILIVGKKKDLPIIVSTMESALDTLYQWFCRNDMKVNTAKTQMLVLGTPAMLRTLPPVTVTLWNSSQRRADREKPRTMFRQTSELPGASRCNDCKMHRHANRAQSRPSRYAGEHSQNRR